jgi:hypothetical protein|tara:strand:+ start:1875 stop:2555 length:681 start_codon:yes stop_codon:yes gene_type:complete
MEFRTGPKWDERIIHLEPAKKIGVLISSGVDSTTLFKLLYDNFINTSIRIFNVQTSDDPEKPVIDAILNQLGVDMELEIVGKSRWNWPMSAHYPRLCLAFQEIRDTTDVEELYCGNILPPHSQFFPRWDPTQKGIAKRPWLTNDPFLKNPFEHLEKYHVLDLGIRGGFDSIYDFTISCNTHATIPCGDCMGCLEVDYGYDQLYNEGGTSLDGMTKDAVMKYGAIGW